MTREAIATANAEADHWKRKFEASQQNLADLQADRDEKAKEVLRLRGVATDHAYMMQAYRNMLGPKGAEVAAMWERQGVKRQHISWGPVAFEMAGEERAQCILDFENAPKRKVGLDDLDANLGPSIELGPKKAPVSPASPDPRTHTDGGEG